MTSVLKAIDTCFKIFHVFNVQYPAASDHIWILMQRKLYKFITKYDKTPPYILEIINVLVITHTNDHIRTCRVRAARPNMVMLKYLNAASGNDARFA